MLKSIAILFVFVHFVHSKQLPKFLHDLRCSPKKDLKACFMRNGNIAIPLVAEGIPEYHIPKMNPMEFPFVNLISTPTLSLNFTKLKIHGLAKLKFEDLRLNAKRGFFVMVLNNPNITLEGEYSADGKLMVMPIKGSGRFSVVLKNGVYKVTDSVPLYEKDGVMFYGSTETRIDYKFERLIFNFENLFEGNKELGDQLNTFLNENWDLVVMDFGPGIAKTVSKLIENIFDRFCAEVPVKNFWLDV